MILLWMIVILMAGGLLAFILVSVSGLFAMHHWSTTCQPAPGSPRRGFVHSGVCCKASTINGLRPNFPNMNDIR